MALGWMTWHCFLLVMTEGCVCMCVLIVYFFSLLSKSYVLWFILKQVSVLWAWSSCEHNIIYRELHIHIVRGETTMGFPH